MSRDNARHERCKRVRRGNLTSNCVHIVPARDVIFSCCNSSLVRASSRAPGALEWKERVALARAVLVLSFSRSHARARASEGRRESGRILQTRVYTGSRRATNSQLSLSLTFFTSQFAHRRPPPRESFFKRKMFSLDHLFFFSFLIQKELLASGTRRETVKEFTPSDDFVHLTLLTIKIIKILHLFKLKKKN